MDRGQQPLAFLAGRAPPSRHASGHPYQWLAGRDLDTPPAPVPSVLLERLQPRQLRWLTGPVQLPTATDGSGERYARAALAKELARVAAAPVGQRNRQLWESTRNLYNLVATGALDDQQVHHGLLQAAERCGLLGDEPRRPAAPWPPAARSAWPTPARPPTVPAPTPAMRRHPRQPERAANELRRGGEGDGRHRPPDRLVVSMGWARAAAKQSPHPPRPPRRGGTPV